MTMVWAKLDERYSDPLMIADGVCKEIEELNVKTLGREFVPRFYSLQWNMEVRLEAKEVQSDVQVRCWITMLPSKMR